MKRFNEIFADWIAPLGVIAALVSFAYLVFFASNSHPQPSLGPQPSVRLPATNEIENEWDTPGQYAANHRQAGDQ